MISSLAVALRGVGYDSQTWALRGWAEESPPDISYGRGIVSVTDTRAFAVSVSDEGCSDAH